jgi:hypothetical protein
MGHESNSMNLKSCRLNQEANLLNREIYQVALKTNHVSLVNNLNAAQMLSVRALLTNTRLRFSTDIQQTTQIVTPIVIVTGYFSTQEKVFGFSRDAKSFLVCLLVVSLVLRVWNLMTLLISQISWWKNSVLAGILLGQWDRVLGDRKLQVDGKFSQPCPILDLLTWPQKKLYGDKYWKNWWH